MVISDSEPSSFSYKTIGKFTSAGWLGSSGVGGSSGTVLFGLIVTFVILQSTGYISNPLAKRSVNRLPESTYSLPSANTLSATLSSPHPAVPVTMFDQSLRMYALINPNPL